MSNKVTSNSAGTPSAPKTASDLREIVAGSQLIAVDTLQLVVHRVDPKVGQPLPPVDASTCTIESNFGVLQPSNPLVESSSFLVQGQVRYLSRSGENRPVAEIAVVLRLTYTFAGRTEPLAGEVLSQFANQVALHHAWPFMRERVAAACQIVGVPPYVLPLRKLVG